MSPSSSPARHGAPEDLSTDELLAAIAGVPSVREVVSRYPLEELARESPKGLRDRGLTPAAARRLACAFEVGRRASARPMRRGEPFRSSNDIFASFHDRMRHLRLERFILEQLSPIPQVEKIRSSFALKQVRYKTALPLDRQSHAPAATPGRTGTKRSRPCRGRRSNAGRPRRSRPRCPRCGRARSCMRSSTPACRRSLCCARRPTCAPCPSR